MELDIWTTAADGSGEKYKPGVAYKKNAALHLFAKYKTSAKIGKLPTPKRDGYKFIGWFTEAEGGVKISKSTLVSEDVTYYAHWQQK